MNQYYKYEDSDYIYYTNQVFETKLSGYQKLCRSDYVVKKGSLEVIKMRNPDLIPILLDDHFNIQQQGV